MAFSGKTLTQPAVGKEAKRILKALENGTSIKGPGFAKLLKQLSQVREPSDRTRRYAAKKAQNSV